MEAVRVAHRACGLEFEVDEEGVGHPDACPNCGAVVSGEEVLADAADVLTQDEREREQDRRHDQIVERRALPH